MDSVALEIRENAKKYPGIPSIIDIHKTLDEVLDNFYDVVFEDGTVVTIMVSSALFPTSPSICEWVTEGIIEDYLAQNGE